MSNRNIIGSGYFGSATVQTSTANVEIIQQHIPTGYYNFTCYKLKFLNNSICTVKVNGSDPIYLAASQGFNSDYYDQPIYSFVIVTNAIGYTYWGCY